MTQAGWARSLQARLIAVVLSVALPAGAALVALVALNAVQTHNAQTQALAAQALAVSSMLDTHLGRQIATVENIAASDAVAAGDWGRVAGRIARLGLGPAQWIVVSDGSGRTLLNTYGGPTAGPRQTGLPRPANILAALDEDRSRVSGLFVGTRSGRPVVAIDTPVRGDPDDRVVSLVFTPDRLLTAVRDADIPDDAMVTIVDAGHRVVARTRDPARFVGRPATDSMIAAMKRADSGVVPSRSLDGQRTEVAFHTSRLTGWTTMVVVPRRQLELPIWGNVAGILAALLVVGLLSFLVVRRQARIIACETVALQADAADLGSGQRVAPRPSRIEEFGEIQAALELASAELARREERQQLLIHELNHRVKNTLATVQALAVQTLRGDGEGQSARFQERLVALGQAHDLLTQTTWTDVDVRSLVARCAGHADDRVRATGPSLMVAPEAALALCMCLHELQTNSLKYGGLSVEGGHVALSWGLEEDGAMSLVWREMGGPAAPPSGRKGFGTQLMDRLAKNELGGAFEREYTATGLVVRGRFRLKPESRWSDPAKA